MSTAEVVDESTKLLTKHLPHDATIDPNSYEVISHDGICVFRAKSVAIRMEKKEKMKNRVEFVENTPDQSKGARRNWAKLKGASKLLGVSARLVTAKDEKKRFLSSLMDIIVWKRINILLIFLPVAWYSQYDNWPATYVFWLNFIAMIPLASMLGDFTEELAAHTNQSIGGLINATFGNAVELVVGINALRANEIEVVQASMLGSIFSNLILVLGMCFFVGGLKYKEQLFNGTMVRSNLSLVALSSLVLVVSSPSQNNPDVVVTVSRLSSIFLVIMYCCLLIFQLKTHASLFEDDVVEDTEIPMLLAFVGLTGVTWLVTIFSGYLVESIDGFVVETNIGRNFVGLVVLPIIGNAVEHMTAVTMAAKNKMNLSLAVAVGSSTQIALFGFPLMVLVGWFLDVPMTLDMSMFDKVIYLLSVVIVSICLGGGKSNWLDGAVLMITYCILALGFFYEDS